MTSSRLHLSEENDSKKLNFSIEHILNRAGNQESNSNEQEEGVVPTNNLSLPCGVFPWLHCTRYCPPKIPRNQRRETPQRRQLGRHPRIPFTTYQLALLEEKFKQSPYLSSHEVKAISQKLDLADIRVKIWFQNRRARERREKSFLRNQEKVRNETVSITSIMKGHTVQNSIFDITVTNEECTLGEKPPEQVQNQNDGCLMY